MKTLAFYGVCDCHFKLDDVVWRTVEDPQDGYRSMLEKIERVTDTRNLTFSSVPFAQVQVRKCEELSGYDAPGYELVDIDGHVWLKFGTDNLDDYYPCFVFEYSPPQRLVVSGDMILTALPTSFEEFIA